MLENQTSSQSSASQWSLMEEILESNEISDQLKNTIFQLILQLRKEVDDKKDEINFLK